MTDEYTPKNDVVEAVAETPEELQPSEDNTTPAAEFPLGPKDGVWRLLGAYAVYSLFSALPLLMTEQLVADGYALDALKGIWNVLDVLIVLVVCRVFFGPLAPRIREVWGHTWVPIPDGIKITGIMLFFFFALKSAGNGYRAEQEFSLLELLVALTFTIGNMLTTILIEYGVVYRLFARFSMRTALIGLVLSSFLFSGFMMQVYFNLTMHSVGWQIHWLVFSLALAAWSLYTYKRLNTLAPLVLMEAGLALVYVIGWLCR